MKDALDDSLVDIGSREAGWIVEAARDPKHAVEMARRRAAGEPLQYVTGHAYFRRLDLRVGPGVLIPRPETELVAERAMARLPRGGTLVDMGAGSGAIALAVKDERPDSRVIAVELDDRAFEWLDLNVSETHLEIDAYRSNLFDELPIELTGDIDVVVSNPPYVSTEDAGSLPVDVIDHEPRVALFADGDGLKVIRRLAGDSEAWLRHGGWLVSEIGESQASEVGDLLAGSGFSDVAVYDDLAGRPRIVEGRRP